MNQNNFTESTPYHAKTREELKTAPFQGDTSMNAELFAYRLRQCRKFKRITQKQAADCFNIRERQWQRYENREAFPTVEGLIQIADFFSVSIDYLLGRSDTSTFDPVDYSEKWSDYEELIELQAEETRKAQITKNSTTDK